MVEEKKDCKNGASDVAIIEINKTIRHSIYTIGFLVFMWMGGFNYVKTEFGEMGSGSDTGKANKDKAYIKPAVDHKFENEEYTFWISITGMVLDFLERIRWFIMATIFLFCILILVRICPGIAAAIDVKLFARSLSFGINKDSDETKDKDETAKAKDNDLLDKEDLSEIETEVNGVYEDLDRTKRSKNHSRPADNCERGKKYSSQLYLPPDFREHNQNGYCRGKKGKKCQCDQCKRS